LDALLSASIFPITTKARLLVGAIAGFQCSFLNMWETTLNLQEPTIHNPSTRTSTVL
jgi:hypothetical protein